MAGDRTGEAGGELAGTDGVEMAVVNEIVGVPIDRQRRIDERHVKAHGEPAQILVQPIEHIRHVVVRHQWHPITEILPSAFGRGGRASDATSRTITE